MEKVNKKYQNGLVCTIISHTPYSLDKDGEIIGLGSTVEEIDHLSKLFIKIFHCAPFHSSISSNSFIKHKSKNIQLIPLKPAGGEGFLEKIKHVIFFYENLNQIKKGLKFSDMIHFRLPTGLGILLLPWILCFWKKGLWLKYAGSWKDNSAPLSYKLQRIFLKVFPRATKISINGKFEGLGINFFDFINPCFDNVTLKRANNISRTKDFKNKLRLLFVGRIEPAKGIDELFTILGMMKNRSTLHSLTIIGESNNLIEYKNWAKKIPMDIRFKGSLPRDEVFKYYAKSDILILLSKTEGFPKVIMEAGAFGCVSILSDLPNFNFFIKNNHNGIILNKQLLTEQSLEIQKIMSDRRILKKCSTNITQTSKIFTFENYLMKIKRLVLNK